MIVAFDADILCLLLYPSITPPIDPGTGKPVERARARLQHLVTELEASRARIVVPAPALAEFLVVAGDRGPEERNAAGPGGPRGAGTTARCTMKGRRPLCGGMAEWLKAAVLKTVGRESVSWVRIPVPPPRFDSKSFIFNGLAAGITGEPLSVSHISPWGWRCSCR